MEEGMAKWREHSLDFKQRVVEQMRRCENISELAEELKLDRGLMYTWKRQLEGRPEARRADLSQSSQTATEKKLRAEIRLLKEALGEKSLEVDFFAGALRRIEEQRRQNSASGEPASTPKSERGRNRRKAN
jgi:transposase-like protein